MKMERCGTVYSRVSDEDGDGGKEKEKEVPQSESIEFG